MAGVEKKRDVLLWICCLAAVAVGAKNFEMGLSLDAPLYATISRNMARGASWFRMDCNIPDFSPFAEHPHLGFWLEALVFKVLPMQDWAARVLGHLFYVGFLFMFYGYVKRKGGEVVAVLTVLQLWTFHLFANIFSTFYLDPGVLFFGALSIILWEEANLELKAKSGVLSGLFFALAVMYKGLGVLGFGPAYLWLAVLALYRKRDLKKLFTAWGGFLGASVLVLGIYVLAVKSSDCPEFFSIYWKRQVTDRFAHTSSVANIFRWSFWFAVWKYTNFLLPLAFLTLKKLRSRPELAAAWLIPSTYLLQVSAAGLTAGQYLIMAMPWIAWLVAEAVRDWVKWPIPKLVYASQAAALLALFLVQYVPIKVHGAKPKKESFHILELSKAGAVKNLYLDYATDIPIFIIAASYAWYSDVKIAYPDGVPKAQPGWAYYYSGGDLKKNEALLAGGWCPDFPGDLGRLYLPCAHP